MLASPPPRLAVVEEAAHPTFNSDRELSTLLSIMDELEEKDVLEESAIDEDLDEAEDEAGDIMTLVCAPCAPTAEGPAGKSVVSTGPSELALSSVGAISGLDGLANRYMSFQCKCQDGNCLQELKGSQLKAAYAVTHPEGKGTSPSTVNKALHGLLWSMKTPLPHRNSRAHNYKIPSFHYDGTPLCKRGWEVLFGATSWGMRVSVSLVLWGVSPVDVAAKRGAALLVAAETRVEAEVSEKRRLTVDWLHRKYLCTMEFMPNENRIVLRGVGSMTVHKEMYETQARAGGFYLSYKQWYACMKPAAAACVAAEHGVSADKCVRVRVTRSARHSNFPMCTTCDTTSKEYVRESSNPLADPDDVAEARKQMLDHQRQFAADRTCARSMRYATHDILNCSDLYECDDKCGSFWCKCPVVGRQNKGNVKQVYDFAVQANVVCGPGGVLRLSIVPKTVNTGANFGLSTLLSALYAAQKGGRLKPHVRRLLRHTDGGSDNVSKLTHIFHWLLVYVGCWQEVLWFIFDAGHSHTEIADRLFSLMKKIFETDSAAHVQGGVSTFEDLEERLKACFQKCPEMKEIVYHFANWDFDSWLKGAVGFHKDDLQKISFDNVFRYLYVGDKACKDINGAASTVAREHGGVQVTYKQHLSDTGSYLDDEWGPLVRVSEETSAGDSVEANRTIPQGVVFVAHPPNLTSEPPREETDEKGRDLGRAAIKRVLQRKDLQDKPRERAFWQAMHHVHGEGLANDIPTLPCSVAADGRDVDSAKVVGDSDATPEGYHTFTFSGNPCPFLPQLQEMVRFPRPYITWDIWREAPPLTFPSHPRSDVQSGVQPESDVQGEADLRDPDQVNHVLGRNNRAEHSAASKRMATKDWLQGATSEDHRPAKNDLYMVHLVPADGELQMGLVLVRTGKVEDRVVDAKAGKKPALEVAWFQRVKKTQAWGDTPTFEPYPKLSKHQKKQKNVPRTYLWLEMESLLVPVQPSNLTKGSRADADRVVRPRLSSTLMGQLRALASARSLEGGGEEEGDEEEDDEEEDEEEGGEDEDEDRWDEEQDEEGGGEGEEEEEGGEEPLAKKPKVAPLGKSKANPKSKAATAKVRCLGHDSALSLLSHSAPYTPILRRPSNQPRSQSPA
jgi:hypothetical protein